MSRWLLWCGWMVLGLLSGSLLVAEDGWQAGVAKRMITPQDAVWMSGYASRDRPAEGTRTELWAKATALRDRKGELGVVLSLDVVGFGRDVADRIRTGVGHSLTLDRSQLWLNASHTHTGPVVGGNLMTMYFLSEVAMDQVERYTARLVELSVEAVLEAVDTLVPAELSYGDGRAYFGVNRRNNPEMLVPKRRFSGELVGPIDYSVPVLRIADQEGRVKGILFGYACHATTLSDYQWSGDYPGYAQEFLEAMVPSAMAQFVAGCGADINPLPRRRAELAIQYGAELAKSVSGVLRGVMEPVSPLLVTRFQTTELRFDSVPTRAKLSQEIESENRYVASRAQHWLDELQGGRTIPVSYPYPVSWWRLGDSFDLISLGGEVVVEYALALKERYGPKTWVSAYSHDVMAYIPSERIWREGGYEGATSMIYYGQPDRWSSTCEADVFKAIEGLRLSFGSGR